MRKLILVAVLLLIVSIYLLKAFLLIPAFGSAKQDRVADYYVENALEDTGSANAVNAIVWDYRGYDTMGEETLLFAGAIGLLLVLRRD